uniref:Uncharacterized protein n=1 Tax=Rhizophora mucronata TaxID=61149 RepID=A0A2P2QL90_RHIMU
MVWLSCITIKHLYTKETMSLQVNIPTQKTIRECMDEINLLTFMLPLLPLWHLSCWQHHSNVSKFLERSQSKVFAI